MVKVVGGSRGSLAFVVSGTVESKKSSTSHVKAREYPCLSMLNRVLSVGRYLYIRFIP